MSVDARLQAITERIERRSRESRAAYLARCARARSDGPHRTALSCGNLAHGFAACEPGDRKALHFENAANIGIVTSYNDMLSAHQPFLDYPERIKRAVGEVGCTAQVAGGVPAMCDGVTQGAAGMDLSLFSRDIIAAATAVALSHNMFDGVLCLGVCDKIVPGLLIGALCFGHLPVIFVPAGPMSTGMSHTEKAAVRQRHARGEVGRDELLAAEAAVYQGRGTCTFYGTANSNQMLMEAMGIHMPGSAFEHPDSGLRERMICAAAERVCRITALGDAYTPLGEMVNERAIVNGLVALLATGGSTNHAIHWITVARAAGVLLEWRDFSALSDITPLIASVYPNGTADVNRFHACGGTAWVIHTLLEAGLMHDTATVAGPSLRAYARRPALGEDGTLDYQALDTGDLDDSVLRPASRPFSPQGGLRVVGGNLGEGIAKLSSVAPERRVIEAPAAVFTDQDELRVAFEGGELERDVVVVVRMQGPRANGMPELHKLTPYLGVLQDRGFRVALVTDGRMSGASGKIPFAIHMTPEAAVGGPLAKLRDGDLLRLDLESGTLEALVDDAVWAARVADTTRASDSDSGCGRELFAFMRAAVNGADEGATVFQRWGDA